MKGEVKRKTARRQASMTLQREPKRQILTQFTIPFTKWQRTKPATAEHLRDFSTDISENNSKDPLRRVFLLRRKTQALRAWLVFFISLLFRPLFLRSRIFRVHPRSDNCSSAYIKNPHFCLSVISKDKADDVLSENDGYGQYFQEKNKKY